MTLVGPPSLMPRGIEAMGCEVSTDIRSIAAADVVYILRMQRERMQEGANYVPSLREYTARWGVTPERLRPGQKVMHPGPMNRGVEIDPRVADHEDALIEIQVRAGLVTRMAVLYDLLTHGPVGVQAASLTEVRASRQFASAGVLQTGAMRRLSRGRSLRLRPLPAPSLAWFRPANTISPGGPRCCTRSELQGEHRQGARVLDRPESTRCSTSASTTA